MVRPAPGIHVAVVEEDVVVLDLKTDGYLCLPGLGVHLHRSPAGRWTSQEPGLLRDLVDLGLFEEGEAALPFPLRRAIRSSREITRTPKGWEPRVSLLTTFARYSASIQGRPVRALIERSPNLPLPTSPDAIEDAARHARLFERWLPFVPGQGECLYRAWLLRSYLAGRGLGSSWVFGVRTWPFAAHCWLQCGDLVLDDDPDRAALYAPILVVSA